MHAVTKGKLLNYFFQLLPFGKCGILAISNIILGLHPEKLLHHWTYDL